MLRRLLGNCRMLRTYKLSSLGYVSLVSSLARAGCATIGNWQSETSCRDPSRDMKRRVEWAKPPVDYFIFLRLYRLLIGDDPITHNGSLILNFPFWAHISTQPMLLSTVQTQLDNQPYCKLDGSGAIESSRCL